MKMGDENTAINTVNGETENGEKKGGYENIIRKININTACARPGSPAQASQSISSPTKKQAQRSSRKNESPSVKNDGE